MPNPNAIVSTVIRFEQQEMKAAPGASLREGRGVSVELEGGRRVRLDPGDERSEGFAQILAGLSEQRLPVYVEVDDDDAVQRLLVPYLTRVDGIREGEEDALEVELEMSHALHLLRYDAEDFDELRQRLRRAVETREPVIVSETDEHEIIDVREYTPGPEGPPAGLFPSQPPPDTPSPAAMLREAPPRLRKGISERFTLDDCISPAEARQVFNQMRAGDCDPLAVPFPCTPFRYPDDGCWARAHEMCRRMIALGVRPAKVWIQGRLRAATRNNPRCLVQWTWHVAPILCVRIPDSEERRPMVIDPSLFAQPVSVAAWQGAQGDPTATLTDTSADVFHINGSLDPTFAATNALLTLFRQALRTRAVTVGPPPYAHCP